MWYYIGWGGRFYENVFFWGKIMFLKLDFKGVKKLRVGFGEGRFIDWL